MARRRVQHSFSLKFKINTFVLLCFIIIIINIVVPGHKSDGDASDVRSEPVTWPPYRPPVTYASQTDNL